jgi:hypothetical protein
MTRLIGSDKMKNVQISCRRNRYLLVTVRSPDHHGLFVDDLASGDGVDLL